MEQEHDTIFNIGINNENNIQWKFNADVFENLSKGQLYSLLGVFEKSKHYVVESLDNVENNQPPFTGD